MRSRWTLAAIAVAGLALTGWTLGCGQKLGWLPNRENLARHRFGAPARVEGFAEYLGVLGGLRVALADVCWLRMAGAWEERDPVKTDVWLRLAEVLDPSSLYFWLNGARILAYDLPAWQIDGTAPGQPLPAAEKERIVRTWAVRALQRLAVARAFHPHSSVLWIEQANLELNRLGDVRAAAESYRRACEQPDVPWFAARIYGELLRRLGEKQAALAWLRALHPRLPANDPRAEADLVLSRIRGLERELAVGPGEAYAPQVSL